MPKCGLECSPRQTEHYQTLHFSTGVFGELPSLRRFLLVCFALYASVCCGSEQEKVALESTNLSVLKSRIDMGEAEVVIPVLESMISNIEEHSGLYDEDLVEPWVLLGDANYVLGQHMEALGAYRSASGVSRIVDGPLAPDQRRIAYREGNLLAQLGAWQEANARFEHAYKIVLKQYDDELDPKRIQGLIQLLDWYESTRKFGAALILYDKLREYVTEQYPPANPFALEVRRKYVNALREVRYPTPGTRLAPRFQVRVPGWEPKRFRKGPSVYARGIAELQDISHIVLSNPVASNVERASTLLDLADWHVLFNRAYKGIEYYEAAWELLETTPELLQQAFDKPNIIHMSVTRSWVSPERGVSEKRKVGIVELSLHINNRGKVVGRKTISTFPDTRMEYRVRVIAEHAKYRPSFKNGKPVRTRNVPFIYRYALAR